MTIPLPSAPDDLAHRMIHTARLIRDPVALLGACAARYGDPFLLPTAQETFVVTGEPRWVREIFNADADVMDPPSGIVEPLVGPRAVVLASGARHRRKRKLLMPPLHGARLKGYATTIREAARRAFTGLQPGERVDTLARTRRLSLDVIASTVLGIRGADRITAFEQATAAVIEGLPAWLLFSPWLQRSTTGLGLGPWSRYQRRLTTLLDMLREEIARARQEHDRADVLAMLVQARDEEGAPLDEDELLDELRTLIIAGHETTATALGWALDALHRNPDALSALHDALGPDPDEARLLEDPWLAAVCRETLRLWPVVPIMARRLAADWILAGAPIPRGTMVCPAVMITHLHPRVWDDPTAWRPERFLDHNPAPAEYYPFGGGSRRCIGAAFATFELQIALGTIVAHTRFRPLRGAPPANVMSGITTRPARPLALTADRQPR